MLACHCSRPSCRTRHVTRVPRAVKVSTLCFYGAPGKMGLPAVGLSSLRPQDRTLEFECYPELKKKKGPAWGPFVFFGAPGEIRTPDRLVRSQVLYPAELRAHCLIVCVLCSGGERGIRTLEGLLTLTPLAGERFRPLSHLSVQLNPSLCHFPERGMDSSLRSSPLRGALRASVGTLPAPSVRPVNQLSDRSISPSIRDKGVQFTDGIP